MALDPTFFFTENYVYHANEFGLYPTDNRELLEGCNRGNINHICNLERCVWKQLLVRDKTEDVRPVELQKFSEEK